jgi:hypothetical protein
MGSALGQWMDHGCDALTMCLALGALVNLMQLRGGWLMALWLSGSWVWLTVAWEEHYTHCLRMDFFASDESEFLCAGIGVLPCRYGPKIWSAKTFTQPVLALCKTHLPAYVTAVVPFTQDKELLCFLMVVFQINAICGSAIMVKNKVAPSSGISGWWSDEFVDALRDLIPFIVFSVGAVYWGLAILWDSTDQEPMRDDPWTRTMFLGCISTAFARMSLSLLHATLTRRCVRATAVCVWGGGRGGGGRGHQPTKPASADRP